MSKDIKVLNVKNPSTVIIKCTFEDLETFSKRLRKRPYRDPYGGDAYINYFLGNVRLLITTGQVIES